MPVHAVASRFYNRSIYAALLTGVSTLALLTSGAPGHAIPLGTMRGGGSYSATANAAAAAVASAQQSSVVAQQSMSALTRALQAVQAVQQAQAAARALAQQTPSGVPNGLAPGGLQVAPGATPGTSLWLNAGLPSETVSGSQVNVTIKQQAAQAILTWQTFNVGQNTTLNFDQQGNRNWVALNRVVDPNQRPSQILGSITASGQVYVINPNGIIFGGASQINVGALIASTANIANAQFLNNGIYSTQTGGTYNPSFTNAGGAIIVEPGAEIVTNTPSSVTGGGGYVLLMGQEVDNQGTILTPDGQTELAAGDNFILRPGYSTTANQTSTTFGNEIAVELNAQGSSLAANSAGLYDGLVGNTGYIEADTGDITLAGESVVQDGVALSTTSVAQRGTIHLLSSASDPDSSVTLAGNSVTMILPDASGATALNAQLATLLANSATENAARAASALGQFDDLSTLADDEAQSRVEIVSGNSVEFQNGSQTLVPGGQIAVSAVNRVQADTGALLDVAGDTAVLNVAANDILVNIQGNEQRDDPNNRDTDDLNNANVYVDERQLTFVPAGTGGYATDRYYTSGGVLEVSGWLNNTGHTIEEWLATGGTITLSTGSKGSVVTQTGSVFDISGGTVQYQSGYVQQSYLIGPDGNLYNVNSAPADLTYSGIYEGFVVQHDINGRPDSALTQYFGNSLFAPSRVYEQGYTVGENAGSLVLSTPTSLFDGTIEAGVTSGVFQDQAPAATNVTTYINNGGDPFLLAQSTAPLAGALTLGDYAAVGLVGTYATNVDFGTGDGGAANALGVNNAVPTALDNTADFDAPALSSYELGGLNVATSGKFTITSQVALAPGAQATFIAPDIDVDANLTAPSGSISLGNLLPAVTGVGSGKLSTVWSPLDDASGTSEVTIGDDSTIDLSGLWTNVPLDPQSMSNLAFTNGGTLSVRTTGAVTLAAGSAIDVSSGGGITLTGTKGGKGGSVTLSADDYSELLPQALWTADYADALSNPLIVDGTITGYGVSGGGSLTLNAGQTVIIGQDASLSSGTLPAGLPAATSVTLAAPVTIPAGAVMPVDYLVVEDTPQGEDLAASYTAGQVLTAPVTLPAGFNVPAGAVFAQNVAIKPALTLSPGLFQSGFSNYAISSTSGVEVASGTALAPSVPVYQITAASLAAPTGADIAKAATLWTPPVYIPNPATDTVAQRAGASVTLSSLNDLTLGQGASISVDPGQTVGLYVNGQATIQGDITAHGGSITITSLQDTDGRYDGGEGNFSLTRSIWIGSGAMLDVSGQAFTDTDQFGRIFGLVQNGGTILLGGTGANSAGVDNTDTSFTYPIVSDAFVVIQPGALLNASGAAAMLDLTGAPGLMTPLQPVLDATNGGTIGLYSANGIYLDGTILAAAGGAGASGGTLDFDMVSQQYNELVPSAASPYGAGIEAYALAGAPNGILGVVPEAVETAHDITLVQDNAGSGLGANAAPGQTGASLLFGYGTLGANQISAGGFDTVSLYTRDLFTFQGNVDLSAGGSLTLAGGFLTAAQSTPDIAVRLAAPYVHLTGWNSGGTTTDSYYSGLNNNPSASPSSTTNKASSFTIAADLIDLDGQIEFGVRAGQGDGYLGSLTQQVASVYVAAPTNVVDAPGFGQVTFDSTGDVRFGNGSIKAPDLTIQAAQVYPLSNASMSITVGQSYSAGYDPDATLTILGNGGTTPAVPASVFGQLSLIAPNIDQDGVLRAPLGLIMFNENANGINSIGANQGFPQGTVTFGAGSITSVSANGLTIPYGGTSDGVTYSGLGTPQALGATEAASQPATGIVISATSLVADSGAVLDLSGGGNLTGAGFISGSGGSVNVLTTPLVNANPAYSGYSSASNQVYAIVPGYASAYAPVVATNGAGNPAIGQQITIGSGVPGLPAGTYTLLPSSYALLPGGFRVEIGGTTTSTEPVANLTNGLVVTSATLSVANTGIHSALPVEVVLSSGAAVRTFSQYNETSYSDFLISQAALFGGVRPALPEDGEVLQITLDLSPTTGMDTFAFDGKALLNGNGDGSVGGALVLLAGGGRSTIDISGPGDTPIAGDVTISSDAINAFNAPVVMIGGGTRYWDDTNDRAGARLFFVDQNDTINVLSGADIQAGEVFLDGSAINVASGATIDTRGLGSSGFDSTGGYIYANYDILSDTIFNPAVLAVANGFFNFLPAVGSGTINIASGASLLTDGSIVIAANGGATIGDDVDFGAKYLTVTQQVVNIGSTASLASAAASGALPQGWDLTQDVLEQLLAPSSASGLPALQELILTAGSSINFVGSVALDASSQDGNPVELVLNTPAIYGLGGANDVASIKADSLVWNGVSNGSGVSASAPPITAGGPGTGLGALQIDAETILFGYDANSRPNASPMNRDAIGFSSVTLQASDQITANSDGTLTVGQSLNASGNPVGGALNLTTPLINLQNGATLSVAAGGAITVAAPAGAAPANTAPVDNVGGALSFSGASIALNTAVAMPSGQLTLTSAGDIDLGAGADIDLSGRGLAFNDLTEYSWGGNLVMTSANGSISQADGSVIDVSAAENDAGAITATAPNGQAVFAGTLWGAAASGYTAGGFTVAAQGVGGFDALNGLLNAGGFYGALSFDIRSGDLVVDQTVKASSVTISVDNGALTVDSLIDASGAAPGRITLSANDNLTLESSAVLDAHGNVLQADSKGQPIDAENRATVELTTTNGTLTLNSGATINVSSPDTNPQGQVIMNAPRTGGTGASATSGVTITDSADGSLTTGTNVPLNAQGNAIAISASGLLNIEGAQSIALNGFAVYANAPYQNNDPTTNNQIIDQAYLGLIDQDSTAFINAALVNGTFLGNIAGLTAYGSAFHLRPGVEIDSATPRGNLTVSGGVDLSGYRYGPNAAAGNGAGEPMYLVIRAGGNLTVKGSISDGFDKESIVLGQAASYTPPLNMSTDTVDFTYEDTSAGEGIYFMDAPGYGQNTNVYVDQTWTVPNDSFYNSTQGFQGSDGTDYLPGSTIPAGTLIVASYQDGFEPGNSPIVSAVYTPATPTTGTPAVLEPMLGSGTMSASIRLVGGADLAAADSRILQTAASLNGSGNVVLDAPYTLSTPSGANITGVSVIRTGTGDLDILAGGNFQELSPFGIYTAGTALPAAETAAYNPGRGTVGDGTVLGAANASLAQTLNPQFMSFTQDGGDVVLSAQGSIEGDETADAAQIGGWLWREGGSGLDEPTAWGINFGSYTGQLSTTTAGQSSVTLSNFDGIGTLGGGNVTMTAGGDMSSIVAAVAGSGRVLTDGSLAQTGGGILTITTGGNINSSGNLFVDLRGAINVLTGNFGTIAAADFGYGGPTDPRLLNPLTPYGATVAAGGSFAPGDGVVDVRARGELAMGPILDPGRVGLEQDTAGPNIAGVGTLGVTWFSLWTNETAINLFGGGDISPFSIGQGDAVPPPIFNAVAAGGDIYITAGAFMMPSPDGELTLLATDSVLNQPFGGGSVGPLAVSLSTIPTPLQPAWEQLAITGTMTFGSPTSVVATNYWGDPNSTNNPSSIVPYSYDYNSAFGANVFQGYGGTIFAFGPETITDDSAAAANGVMSHIYALNGDIVGLGYGQVYVTSNCNTTPCTYTSYYRAAKPVDILAGGDIVGLSGLIMQNSPNDVSMVAASGEIIYAGPIIQQTGGAGLQVAGPGTLEVTAGGNIYEGSTAAIESIGPLAAGDNRPGANVVLQAGVGSGEPGVGEVNWSGFAALYLNPANAANPAYPDTDPVNAGKVPDTYQDNLYAWLQQNYGYTGNAAGAYAYFESLPAPNQRVFLREIYYNELNASGLEYNNPTSERYRSYLRGQDAIAALFPDQRAYNGSVILFNAANGSGYVHTDFGGDIQLLTPGGGVTVGTEGLAPAGSAGLITQGAGNIDIYADDSVELGLSRIMTTFGGNILVWSTTGNINAGKGAKTTVVYTPAKRVYDNYGDVTLSPTVPSTGAGIATLQPIPSVPPGNVNLVAPKGIIDAGEAGIRVSGNLNVAALQIVNAANITVQGTTTGIPTVAAPNIGALDSASSAAGAATKSITSPAQNNNNNIQPSILIVEIEGYGGDDSQSTPSQPQPDQRKKTQEQHATYDPYSPVHLLGNGQLTEKEERKLTLDERNKLDKLRNQSESF
ncbi:MAG: filamentous hemagglutinin family protein [Pseudomonadota bacterium]